ncbi:hypothetical protein KKH43_03090 [Patescibacteria group bacterium]|nr:hypothetical protein [Patescibacteria group bacterium]
MAELFHTIYVPKDITPDTLIAVFLLKEFGDTIFPGIHQARIDRISELKKGETSKSLEHIGIVPLGFDDARFTSNKIKTLTEQIAKYLDLQDENAVTELTNTAKNKSGEEYESFYSILQNLIDEYQENSNKAFKAAHPVIRAHFNSLRQELEPIPTEYMQKLNEGKVHAFITKQKDKELRVIVIESSHPEMAPFLHNHKEIEADIVGQKFDGGHINITTKHRLKVDLGDVAAIVRIEDIRKKKVPFDNINWNDIREPGRLEYMEEWLYDPEEGTILNTKAPGIERSGASQIDAKELKMALLNGLDFDRFDSKCPPVGCKGKKCKFYFYNLMRCRKRRLNVDIDQKMLDMQKTVKVLDRDSIVKMKKEERPARFEKDKKNEDVEDFLGHKKEKAENPGQKGKDNKEDNE